MESFNDIVAYLTNIIQNGGVIFGVLLILIESIIPALPLGVFIALNINAFGLILGILISWLATCTGCYLSYLLFNKLGNKFNKKYRHNRKISKVINKMKTIDFANLVIIIALPFTPAFAINIAAGIVGISKKKFILALLIGKIFMVIFWGCIGKSLFESITDIKTLFIVAIFILVAFIISKLVSKKMNIE